MTRFTWQPVSGAIVEVTLEKPSNGPIVVTAQTTQKQLGTVFQTPGRGWHFARHGVLETRGSQLATRDVVVSALLLCLRQEGKV